MAVGCLFSFTEEVTLNGPSAPTATTGLTITMMPSGVPDELLITSNNGAHLGVYAGDYATQMLRCMRKKYVYQGVIESLGTVNNGSRTAMVTIRGLGQL